MNHLVCHNQSVLENRQDIESFDEHRFSAVLFSTSFVQGSVLPRPFPIQNQSLKTAMTASSKIDNQVVAFVTTSPKANHATISECIVDDGRVLVGGAESDMIKSLATASDLSRTTTHDGALCINRVFLPREEALSTFLSILSFPVRHLQPRKMVVTTPEICSKLQPRTTEPLYSTLFCMRCQRGAGPSLCESWQNFHPWDFYRCNSGIEGMKFVSTNLIKHHHLIIQVDH